MATSSTAAVSRDPDSTRARLLDAVEGLVAEHGIDAVSLRSVNGAAGSNVAAVHYHFGSKEALVVAALERQMAVLAEERLALLAPLERLRRPPLHAVVEAIVMPLARLAERPEGQRYVRFLAALDRAGDPWWRLVADAFAPQWDRIEPVLERALPHVAADVRAFRLAAAATTLLGVLAEPDRYAAALARDPDGDRLFPAVVDVVTAILSGPPTRRRKP